MNHIWSLNVFKYFPILIVVGLAVTVEISHKPSRNVTNTSSSDKSTNFQHVYKH